MNSQTVKVELWRLIMPLAAPHVAAKATRTTTYALLAYLRDSQGHKGIGYSSFRDEAGLDQALDAAKSLVARADGSLPAFINIERIEEQAFVPSTPHSKGAANALSLAAWDLAAQQLGVACADLWGRPPGRESLDCYASSFWMDKSGDQLVAEAIAHQKTNYRLVKMRVGPSIPESFERIAAVQKVYQEPRTIALECGSSWTVDITTQFMRETRAELLWIEDPVDYTAIDRIERNDLNVIGAGEKCTSMAGLMDLYNYAGIRSIIIDVQYVGGPVRFLEAARLFNALGANVGAHRFSNYSIHLLACLPRSMPIEMLDWTNPAIRPLPDPDPSGKLPIRGPGFCIEIDQAVIDRHGVLI